MAWFDNSEYSQDRDNAHHFPRVQHIKELLFRVHKLQREGLKDQYFVSLKKYFKILKSKELTMFKRNIKTYADILTPPND